LVLALIETPIPQRSHAAAYRNLFVTDEFLRSER